MRILFFSDYFGGNTTTFIYNEVIGLSEKNKIRYVCTERENPDKFPFDDVVVLPYKIDPIRRKIRWHLEIRGLHLTFKDSSYSNRLNKIIEEFKPDIIQCHFAYEALRLTDNFKRTDIPIVITFQGHDASYHLKRASYVKKLKELAQRPNIAATFVTTFLRKQLEEKGIVFSKARVIYSGTRLDLFQRKNYTVAKDPFVFLQVSNFEKRKGQMVTLHAFKKLVDSDPSRDYRLILAGNAYNWYADYYQQVKALAVSLGIEEKVLFPGWVTPVQAKELMENAHCFVHHSITVDEQTEGIPNAIMEAMAMEMPVISTLHAGIPELVEDDVNGYLVKENDVDAYAEKMKSITQWDYVKKNREKIMEKFELSKRVASLESFYGEVMNG
jgi:colanic acid/amylovoran biosynthesis glycosyltransferase